jgi:hypothetical protein
MVAGLGIAACAPRPYYGYNRQMTDRDAWEIVRRDPCRYDEYSRFAKSTRIRTSAARWCGVCHEAAARTASTRPATPGNGYR